MIPSKALLLLLPFLSPVQSQSVTLTPCSPITAANPSDLQTPSDIILAIGQSNTVGRGTPIGPEDIAYQHPNLLQLGRYNNVNGVPLGNCSLIPASDPLHHPDFTPKRDENGFVMRFANSYVREKALSGRKVIIMPGAMGGTGFSTFPFQWGLNKSLYNNTLQRTKALLELNASNRVIAILWLQGESDITFLNTTEYTTLVSQMIADLRSQIRKTRPSNPAVPFIAGEMVYKQERTVAGMAIQEGIRNLWKVIEFSGFVTNRADNGTYLYSPDGLHYGAEGLRILGGKYWSAYTQIVSGTWIAPPPVTTTIMTALPVPTGTPVFTRPAFPANTTYVGNNAKCGPSNSGAVCKDNLCCAYPLNTKDHYCGSTEKHCWADRCNQAFGSCWVNPSATTSSIPITTSTSKITSSPSTTHPTSTTSSKSSTTSAPSRTTTPTTHTFTRPTFPPGTTFVSTNAKCGPSNNGAVCRDNLCCAFPLNTADYYCGSTEKHCGRGRCEGRFGSCWVV
ncbi:hypothetical protein HK097_006972 [Rhizophlyctis rosea]|uniref:Sialate O-acetylesterase domain-containing protein n=1 Tax=Rhizophlyctis rosea TaxID=64517 RepID=A0AAD5SF97_9FUNG|nr:hypothetical protein HK097_006972 [Rhizophlyctis rosea]